MKLKTLFAILLAFTLVAAACGDDEETSSGSSGSCDDVTTKVDGTLTVATGETVYPPWMGAGADDFDDPTTGTGYEGALVYALAEELGFSADNVTFVRTPFDTVIAPGEKDWDFNIQQYSITAERQEIVSFSAPYYEPDKAVIALPGSPVADATSFEELRAAEWGATIGTTDLDYLENVIGVEDVAIFNDQAAVFLALSAGQIDATVAALPTALFVTAVQAPDTSIVALLTKDASDAGLGMLFDKDSPLIACVDAALERIIAAGAVDALVAEYLLPSEDIAYILE